MRREAPARGRWARLAALAGLGLALRALVVAGAPIIGDETYYWLWSRRLDWAYYDHPAGVALLLRLSTALLGSGRWGLRWLNALLGAACVPLVYGAGRRLLSERAGIVAAAFVAVGAPYLIVSGIVYTDALHLALLLLNLRCFAALVEPGAAPRGFLAWGLSLALLFNTKYSAYLYAAGLGLAILLDHRELLRQRRFWLAAAIAAAGLLPVVGWNAAHGWASFRWQLTHLVSPSPGGAGAFPWTPLANLRHALGHLTWPVMLAALPALVLLRPATPGRRLLAILAGALTLPVLLSPANSPRNLIAGLTLLLLLAGDAARGRLALAGAGLVAVLALAYGGGTVAALWGTGQVPASTLAAELRRETAGLDALDRRLAGYPAPFFALDYQLAGQIAYRTGRPAASGWGQYRLWGIPPLDRATVVSLGYLPEGCVTAQLAAAFDTVSGPHDLPQDAEAGRALHLWHVAGPRQPHDALAARLDFLTLWEVCRAP